MIKLTESDKQALRASITAIYIYRREKQLKGKFTHAELFALYSNNFELQSKLDKIERLL